MTEISSIDVSFTSNGSNFDAEEKDEEVNNNLDQGKDIDEIEEHICLKETIKLLKENRLHDVDVEHLIEELKSLDRRDKSQVSDILEQLIRHLLLLEYWEAGKQENKHHLRAEIQSFRSQLRRHLTPNLQSYLKEELEILYEDALDYLYEKTVFTIDFPEQCPYDFKQLLDKTWFPS